MKTKQTHNGKKIPRDKRSISSKTDNFFYHYKYNLIFFILVLLLLGSLLTTLIDNRMERAKLVNSAEDFTVSLKNQLVIQNEKPDIYITDAHYFDMFVDQGPFIGLDEHLDETTPEEALKFHQREQDPVEQLYGIDIAKSSLFDDIEITGSEMIASVHQKVPVP